MLNISPNKLNTKVSLLSYRAAGMVFHQRHFKYFNRFLIAFSVVFLITLFLPWTQNVSGRGHLTTLSPNERPQTIQSPIPGTIMEWYVAEGDFVNKGDTILRISEVKNEYFDPNLVARTGQQITAKNESAKSYSSKIAALDNQIAALQQEQVLKLEQAKNKLMQSKLKVKSDSIDFVASQTNFKIAQTQLERIESLYNDGLKSKTQLEEKRLKLQETQAKLIAQENKWLASKNEVINAQIDINQVQTSYADKIGKAQSDKFAASSSKFNTEAEVAKLESDYTSYEIRNSLYYVKAPQNGYINKTIKGGLGETFKEGDPLIKIMPSSVQMAVETYVNPIDIPLIHKGEEVRIQFDGWPAIIFSGWPNVSYGTYGGKVVAIDTYISENGKYRVLVAPDPKDQPWPKELRIGSGVYTLSLLNDVPIWFEIWRKLNGFPPDYYTPEVASNSKNSSK